MGKIYQVMVNGIRGEKITIDLCNTEEQMKSITVLQLKEKIAEKLPHGADAGDGMRLIFTDKMLQGDKLLSDYGIQHLSLIQMVIRVPGGGRAR